MYARPRQAVKFSSFTGLAFSTAGQRQPIFLFPLLFCVVPLGKLFGRNVAAEK